MGQSGRGVNNCRRNLPFSDPLIGKFRLNRTLQLPLQTLWEPPLGSSQSELPDCLPFPQLKPAGRSWLLEFQPNLPGSPQRRLEGGRQLGPSPVGFPKIGGLPGCLTNESQAPASPRSGPRPPQLTQGDSCFDCPTSLIGLSRDIPDRIPANGPTASIGYGSAAVDRQSEWP